MSRVWTVVSQKYPQGKEVTSNATTWGELSQDLVSSGCSPENMRCKIKASATYYEDGSAILPSEVYGERNIIFMSPFKTKSGINGKNI